MRILMIAGYPTGGKRSGSVTHVEKLAQHLSEMNGTEVDVITIGRRNETLRRGRVTVHVLSVVRYFSSILLPFGQRSMRRRISQIAPDLIHSTGGGFPYSVVSVSLRHRYPVLVSIFSFAAGEARFARDPVRRLRTALISIPCARYAIPRAPHIIVQSQFTESLVRQRTRESRIHVIPEGVEYGRIQQLGSGDPAASTPDSFIAVNFRRLKGLDILIRAMAIVKRTVPDVTLHIAGSGEQEEELKSLVETLSLHDNVKFLGFMSDQEKKYQLYKACKVVVVPSRWDTEPFATLDGAASGKPVIASESSNSSLVVDGDTGFVYETEDYEQLAARIVEVLTNDELRKRMGEAARERAKEYDWPRIAERTVEVYKQAIADFSSGKALGAG
jgi:1,4-alpha-glucan branching enzyme